MKLIFNPPANQQAHNFSASTSPPRQVTQDK